VGREGAGKDARSIVMEDLDNTMTPESLPVERTYQYSGKRPITAVIIKFKLIGVYVGPQIGTNPKPILGLPDLEY
jgi:hypothetical protein